MPGGCLFLSNQFDWSRRIIANELLLLSPSEIAFQTDQRAVNRGRSLLLNDLEVCTITGKSWCGDRLGSEDMGFGIHVTLIPGDEMAHIAEIVADGSRCKILLFEERLFIHC